MLLQFRFIATSTGILTLQEAVQKWCALHWWIILTLHIWHGLLGNSGNNGVFLLPVGSGNIYIRNRKSLGKTLSLTILVFLLSGLWHGAAWTFIAWGALHAGYRCISILCHRIRPVKNNRRAWGVIQCIWRFGLVSLAWVFFRASSIRDAYYVIRYALSGLQIVYIQATLQSVLGMMGEIYVITLLLCLFMLLRYDHWSDQKDVILWTGEIPVYLRWPAYSVFVLLLILLIPKNEAAPFIYFQL